MFRSYVNINLIICMKSLGVGSRGHVCLRAVPLIYMMYGISLAMKEHFVLWCVQLMIHDGMVLLLALVGMRCLVCAHDLSNFDN